MVELNLTFIVQLLLFLVFLWGTHRFIIRPILRVIDEREVERKNARETAQSDTRRADALEQEYATKFRACQRKHHQRAEQARRAARKKYLADLGARTKEADQAVAAVRDAARTAAAAERDRYPALAPALAKAIEKRLELGENAP